MCGWDKTNLCSENLTAPSTEAVINLDTAKGVSVSLSILSLADDMTGLSSMPCESNGPVSVVMGQHALDFCLRARSSNEPVSPHICVYYHTTNTGTLPFARTSDV